MKTTFTHNILQLWKRLFSKGNNLSPLTVRTAERKPGRLFNLLFFLLFFMTNVSSYAQFGGPMVVTTDPLCSSHCCSSTQPCNCSAGITVTGGIPPYIIVVTGSSGIVGNTACVTGLCPGTYTFEVRSQGSAIQPVFHQVTVGGSCCKLICRDTSFCFNVPDSMIVLNPPTYADTSANSGAGTGPSGCAYDSIYSYPPAVFPVGTTVVTWYVHLPNGSIDSCTQNVIRNPPTVYNISFTTSPPIVAGVINICNGQSITFNDNSTGITGLLWNFGNGYYSSNATHTEPSSHYPPGTYYDTLTVYDACGTPHDTAFMVVVDSTSGPDITCISVVCPGDTVTYHTNVNCTNYNWVATGGTIISPPNIDSCTVVWGPGPNGTIALSVSGCTPPVTCSVATIKTVNIVPATLPVAGDTILCAGATATYCVECIPGNEHSWELMPANAGTVTGQNTCCVTVHFNPNFFGTVQLVVNYHNVLTGSGCNLPGNCQHDPGCGGSGVINITVKPIFGISGPSKVCPNVTSSPFNGMNLTNNTVEPATSWKLVTPVPSVLTFANSALLNAYTWNAGPGNYTLVAYAPAGVYCNDSAFATVEVVDLLTPNPITGPDTVCANTPYFYTTAPNMTGVTYTWTVTGGTIIGPSTGSSVQISWNPGGGSVTVYQTLTAAPGCISSATAAFNVTTWPNFTLPIITSSQPIVCLKSTVTYSIPTPLISNGTYTWSVVPATAGNILSANGTNTITIKWVDASITPIYVKLKINRCYDDSVMYPVNLLALPPVPSINYLPSDPCVNVPVSFTTTSAGPFWNWNFGDLGTSTLQNPTHAYTNGGDYTIQLYVTNANGCSDTAYSKIHVDTLPAVPVIVGNSSVCFNATEGYSFSEPLFTGAAYTWSLSVPVKGVVQSSGQNFINIKWNIPGVDTLKLRVQSPCMDTTIKYVVTIHSLPIAGISLPSPSCIGTPLTFNGSGGVTYNWSFAGGSPSNSTLTSPTVLYGAPGNYAVSLTVTDAFGCTGSQNTTLAVHGLPLAIITGPARICSFPATVNISAVNLSGYSFAWSPSGNTPTITPTINSASSFYCVVTNIFGCTATSNTVFLDTTSCPVDTVPGCNTNDTIDYTKTPPVCLSQTYSSVGTATLVGWDFGDGGTAGPTSPVSHTFPYPGNYIVTVYGASTGIDGSGNICYDTIYKYHTVTIPFDVHFDFTYACSGGNVMQVNFSNTSLWLGSATSYNWTWYDISTSTTISTAAFPPAITLSPGTHIISLTAFDPVTGATCTETKTLNVPTPITAAFSVSSPVCQGTAATFTDLSVNIANESTRLFNNGNGATGNTNPSNLIYANSGTFSATLFVTDIYGCSSTATQSVNVLPAGTGTITVGVNNCDSVQLTASGSAPFTWNVISPPPVPSNPVYVHNSGFYSVTGIGVNGCPYTAGPVFVTVKHSAAATISGKTTYCQGENLDLKTTSAGVSFVWTQQVPFAGVVGTNAPNLNIPALTPGTITYSVTVTNANGCTSSASITVTVDPVPSSAYIDSSGSLTFCQGDSVLLTVVPPGATYLWSKSPTPALTSPADTNDSLWVSVSGTYSVIVQTVSGCAYPAIAPVTVTVNPVPPANITGDTVLCVGDQLLLNTTTVGGGTYLWNGPIATGTSNPFIVPNMTLGDGGLYTVVVTNSYGCTSSDQITVVVNPAPVTPTITSNPGGVLCEGQLVTFTAGPPPVFPVVYTWSTGQLGASITAALAGNYFVTATNQYGCSSTSNIITIHPQPDLSCVPTGCYDFCNECDSVTIPGPFGLASYMWQQLVGNVWVNYSGTQNLTVLPPGGIFRLLASNSWGCSDSTDTLKINFHDCCTPITTTIACVDTTCQDFSDNQLHNFGPYAPAPNVLVSLSNAGGQYAGDIFLKVTDLAGASAVQTDTSYLGKWCCGKFSYDFKIIDDGVAGSPNIQPKFRIFNSVLGKGFLFTANVTMNETSGWKHIVACGGLDSLPQNTTQGTWTPISPAVISDWQAVASNLTDVVFQTQYFSAGEAVGIDNVCYTPQTFTINCVKTKVCGGYVASVEISDTAACNTFHYEWSNGSHEPFLELPPPGTYCVKVSNCCGCIDSCCITIPPDTNVIVVTDTVYHINCDSLYGAIKLRVTGGIPPYHYQWSNGNTTDEAYGLAAGAYSIIITDSVGCDKIVHDTVTVQGNCNCNQVPPPPPPVLNVISVTPDSCNHGGCINISFSGCCPRFALSWHSLCNAAIGDSIPWTKDSTIFCHLSAGSYTIYIGDPCGNVVSQTVIVPSVNPPLQPYINYLNCGQQICVGAEGGCGPYSYQWSNGGTSNCLTNFQPCQDYTVTITDAMGCTQSIQVSPPQINFTNIVKPTCCAANGSLCATVCFGPTPYTYLWSNGDTSLCLNNLAAGTYCLYVTNALGQTVTCCYTLNAAPVTPPNVHFNFSNCGAIVTAVIDSGACGPFTHYWSNGSTELFAEGIHPCDSLTFTIVLCDGSVHHYGIVVPFVSANIQPENCVTGLGSICVFTECMRCPPYSYSWSPVNATQASDSNCIQMPSGNYQLCITNSCGDVICCNYFIPPVDSSQIIHVIDTVYNIDCDHAGGGIDIDPYGGHPPYTYLWSTGETTQDITNLQAGIYSVTITDSLGCNTIVHDTVVVNQSCNCNTIPEPPLPTITILGVDPDSCNGRGCIHATFTGCCLWYSYSYYNPCNPLLSYSLAPTRDSTIFCNLNAGLYTIYVQDGCGRTVQMNVNVPSVNPPLTVSLSYGPCASSVCAVPSGGCPPYTYQWPSSTGACLFNLSPCTASQVTVTDARGCSVTKDVYAPVFNFTNVVQPSCCQSNGSLCVNVSCFGPGPYLYDWGFGEGTSCIGGLAAGTYCVTVTNRDGDQVTCCYTLTGSTVTPPQVHFSSTNCGQSVQAIISGVECENFTAHWENGNTNPIRSNVNPCDSITYTIEMCDGSVYNYGFVVPKVLASLTPVSCATGIGAICIDVSCFPCPPYSYSWSSQPVSHQGHCFGFGPGMYTLCITNSCGDTYCCQYILPPSINTLNVTATTTDVLCWGQSNGTVTVSASGGTQPYTGTGTFTVAAGTHTFTVTDANGCTGTVTVHVNEPSELGINVQVPPILCHGGTTTVTINATGGTPPYQGTGTVVVGPGIHTFTVTDANGCTTSTTITIVDPPAIQVSVNYPPILCYGGVTEVEISASGGTGPYQGTGIVTAGAGTHTYTIVDAHGCVGTVTVNIPQPPKVEGFTTTTATTCGGSNGTATVFPSGGTGAYSYYWMPGGQTTQTIGNLPAGTYTVIITDGNGCTGSATATVGSTGSAPATPGPITGPAGACRSTSGIVYSITAVPNATSYIWTLPPGVTGSSTGTSITLSFSSSYAGGFICVAAVNPCGVSAQSCMSIPVITTYPAVPVSITGPTIVCGPTTVTYSTFSSNATSYNWAVTGGGSIVSGQGTSTVTVSIPAGFTQGAVQVTATNCYGTSAVKGILITGIPAHSYSVTGPTYICANSTGTYTMPVVTGASSYVWSVTGDATLGTMTVSPTTVTQVINFGPAWTSGTVSVSAVNACGSFTKSFVVRSVPVQPGSITGPSTSLCNTTATFSIAAVATATSYVWTVPAGCSISGSATGTSVNIVFGPTFTSNSANICVSAVNTCGVGPQRCFTISSRPATPVVTGAASVCKSQTSVPYSVAPVSGATSYAWQVTGGASITPAGTNATVNYNGSTISSVIVRCTASNTCGAGSPGLLNVNVNLACRTQGGLLLNGQAEVYPNPTTGELNVNVYPINEGKVDIRIMDLPGNVLLQSSKHVIAGENKFEFDLSDFAKGMYLLTISGEGVEARAIRIVVE